MAQVPKRDRSKNMSDPNAQPDGAPAPAANGQPEPAPAPVQNPPAPVAAVVDAATDDPGLLKKLVAMYEEDRAATRAELEALRSELGVTKGQLDEFYQWAKEDPSQVTTIVQPPAPVQVPNTDPNAAPVADGTPAPEGTPEGAPSEPQKDRPFWKKVW
jgi:hypothetical protein